MEEYSDAMILNKASTHGILMFNGLASLLGRGWSHWILSFLWRHRVLCCLFALLDRLDLGSDFGKLLNRTTFTFVSPARATGLWFCFKMRSGNLETMTKPGDPPSTTERFWLPEAIRKRE